MRYDRKDRGAGRPVAAVRSIVRSAVSRGGSELDNVLELVVVEAALCLLLASFFFEQTDRHRKHFRWIFSLLALASVACFFNFGQFHKHGEHVHDHEQFHFFLGSKYLSEVRYDAIYDAALLAAVDDGILQQPVRRRDPGTFDFWNGRIDHRREAEVRNRFTPERWREFRHDVEYFLDERDLSAQKVFRDHGNTGSPTWAMTAALFTRSLSLDRSSAHLFAYLDPLLLLALFATAWWALGCRAAALAMIVGLSVPIVYAFLGGSILRMDWLFALGMSVCFFEKKRFRTAGLFLGYAVASKLLAGVMVLPLGLYFLARAVQQRRVDRDHLRYVLFALLGLVVFASLACLFFADAVLWQDYAQRMVTTFQEKYYRGNHSFRDVFLQVVHYPAVAWDPLPRFVAAGDSRFFIGQVRAGFVVSQLILLAGLLFVAVRNPRRVAFALGPLAVFVLLVTNRYYWQMWMIAALVLAPTYRRDWRHTAFLAAILGWIGAGQLMELTRLARSHGGYFGSFGLFWIGAALVTIELVAWTRQRRALAAQAQKPAPEA